jgi:formate hydrogenlyase subunit 5
MSDVQTQAIGWNCVVDAAADRFAIGAQQDRRDGHTNCRFDCPANRLRELVGWLQNDLGCSFDTLVPEQTANAWQLTYIFHESQGKGWAQINIKLPEGSDSAPSISDLVYGADWEEREAEDLFGLHFSGHPKLGEFVLHEHWPEGVNPMRREFAVTQHAPESRSPMPLYPSPILEAPGAMALPIGPVFSDFAESAQYVLETTGEEMIRVVPRFFYKYRSVEKIAEGRKAEDVLLLAERFSGSSAFAHGLAFCQAVEAATNCSIPRRAAQLRCLFAELERLRHHVGHIAAICGSTGLDVAQAQAAIIEEELLRFTCVVTGHRYLFGAVCLGGMAIEVSQGALDEVAARVGDAQKRLAELEKGLRFSSSFLDRIEEVGIVTAENARAYSLVGPVARASGCAADFRVLFPYAEYQALGVQAPTETEGDGYARLRILFREAAESVRLVRKVAGSLAAGEVCAPVNLSQGVGMGTVEAPIGAALHCVRLDESGRVLRYRVRPPSFRNWMAFRIAVEGFGFQDFPIILATFGLSNAECDR